MTRESHRLAGHVLRTLITPRSGLRANFVSRGITARPNSGESCSGVNIGTSDTYGAARQEGRIDFFQGRLKVDPAGIYPLAALSTLVDVIASFWVIETLLSKLPAVKILE